MPADSPYKVSLEELDSTHVSHEDMVEEHDVTPPVPEAKSKGDRDRESMLRVGIPGL